jgi:hypothetical protein
MGSSAPSPDCCRRLAAALVVSLLWAAPPVALAAGAESPPPTLRPDGGLEVATCDPCTFLVARNAQPRAITFAVEERPGGWRAVRELRVTRASETAAPQVLPVEGMAPIGPGQTFFVGAADVNFDGYADLYLATSRGVANAYADYWLFVPSTGEFSPLGRYPIFTRDPASRTLSTFERGGEAGLIYRKQKYQFVKGALTRVESEVQEETDRPGVFRRKTFRLAGGKLRLVRTEIVKAPAPRH